MKTTPAHPLVLDSKFLKTKQLLIGKFPEYKDVIEETAS